MDCGIGAASCKKGDQRLLDKMFKSKPIKRGGKILFWQFKKIIHSNFKHMSSQITNNYTSAPTSPNSYIFRRLNNMNKAQAMKKEWDDWTVLYYKMMNVKITESRLSLFYFLSHFLFLSWFIFHFSIFRTLGLELEVIDHISHIWWCGHNIWSWDLRESYRRF